METRESPAVLWGHPGGDKNRINGVRERALASQCTQIAFFPLSGMVGALGVKHPLTQFAPDAPGAALSRGMDQQNSTPHSHGSFHRS